MSSRWFEGSSASALRRRAARWLETGGSPAQVTMLRALAGVYAPFASRGIARRVVLPDGIGVIAVGGATLGGSGKTPLALACATWLARHERRVVIVGHGYRAKPGRSRMVTTADRLADVGDEARACVRAVERDGLQDRIGVVVGPDRQAAVGFAARAFSSRTDFIVVDGPLQFRPRRATLSLLAVDAHAPWGAGELVPAGDLRAPRDALVAAADLLVPVEPKVEFVDIGGERRPLRALTGLRCGLFTAIARPGRVLQMLERAEIRPSVVLSVPDHGPVGEVERRFLRDPSTPVDVWLVTEKCSEHLQGMETAPRATLVSRPELSRACSDALRALL